MVVPSDLHSDPTSLTERSQPAHKKEMIVGGRYWGGDSGETWAG